MLSDASWLRLELCCLGVVVVGATGMWVSRAQRRQGKADLRIQSLLTHPPAPAQPEAGVVRHATRPDWPLAMRAASVFGFGRPQLTHSPVAWWLVLAISLFLSRVGASLVVGIVGPLGWASMPVLWIGLSRAYFGWSDGRHNDLLITQFPDAIAMIVRSLGVGVPLQEAIAIVAREGVPPTSIEFARLADELSIGVSLGQAVKGMGARVDLAEYRFFATAVSLQAQTGGGLGETLSNLATLIRRRMALRGRAKALSSEARTSSWILAGLPVMMGTVLWLVNPGYISILFTDSIGRTTLGIAASFLASGAMVMRLIIKKSLS